MGISSKKDAATLDRLRRLKAARDRHQSEFAVGVRAAMENPGGLTAKEIAQAAGISRERAYQIKAGRR